MHLATPVGCLRPGALPILASWIHGDAVGVEVDGRAEAPATVVCGSRTLVLHPERCTLLGLLVAAELLGRRWEVKRLRGQPPSWTRVEAWRQRAEAALRRRFAGLEALGAGVWSAAFADGGPAVWWNSARLRPDGFEPIPAARSDRQPHVAAELVLSDWDLEGVPDALAALVQAIARGDHPLQTLPDFPDVPYVVARVRVGGRHAGPHGFAEVAERLAVPTDMVASIVRCTRQQAEGRVLLAPPELPTWVGARVDGDRLAEARAALRAGREYPVFVAEGEAASVFDPNRHATVIFWDLAGGEGRSLFEPAIAPCLAAGLLRSYEVLGIPTAVQAVADLVVPGPRGRKVHLHLAFELKGAGERWSPLVWYRVLQVIGEGVRLEGEPGQFLPLHLERMAGELRVLAPDVGGWGEGVMLHPILLGGKVMRKGGGVLDAMPRYAAAMELVLEVLEREVGDVGGAWLRVPRELRAAAVKGGRVWEATER